MVRTLKSVFDLGRSGQIESVPLLLGAEPLLREVFAAGIAFAKKNYTPQTLRDDRQNWLDGIPTARDIYDRVLELGSGENPKSYWFGQCAPGHLHFENYRLRLEDDGMISVGNAYWMRDLDRLEGVAGLDRFIDKIKQGHRIGPLPLGCECLEDRSLDENSREALYSQAGSILTDYRMHSPGQRFLHYWNYENGCYV